MPVLLVPGWSDRVDRLRWLALQFTRAGWPASHVHPVDFRDRYGGNAEHAAELSRSVDLLRARTGARRIDMVAHSMGGLAVRYYLHFIDQSAVRRVVFMGTPHRGTWAAYLGWGGGARDMRPDSPFLTTLRALPPVPAGVDALCIHTPTDLRIFPASSARLSELRCQRVWCASHPRLLRSRNVFHAVRAFLEE